MIIDILVGLVLLVSALISFLRGFIREVLTIFGTIGALAAAYFGGPVLSPVMRGWLGVKEGEPVPELFDVIPYTIVADVLSYGLIFIAVLIVLSIISHILAEGVRKVGLGAVDRTLGVAFGLARGFIILALVYIPVKLIAGPEKIRNWFEGSRAHPVIDMGAEWMIDLLPENTFDMPAPAEGSETDARQKLEQMKLLGGETAKKIEDALKEGLKPEEILKSLPDAPAARFPEKGYTEEFRQQMDQLFKDKTPPQPETPQNETPPATNESNSADDTPAQ